MKRIVILVCGLLLLVANSAEARRSRGGNNYYSQPMYYSAPAVTARPAQPVSVATATKVTASPATKTTVTPATQTRVAAKPVQATPVSYSSPTPSSPVDPKKVASAGFNTATAQGVANIMASRGVVGHFGGNPGYEGCGMAGSPQAAYNTCCYANSGMATVDVGYAQGANGMWYCCRRYR